jgi:hypothetical protein
MPTSRHPSHRNGVSWCSSRRRCCGWLKCATSPYLIAGRREEAAGDTTLPVVELMPTARVFVALLLTLKRLLVFNGVCERERKVA